VGVHDDGRQPPHANVSYFETFSTFADSKSNTWLAANAELSEVGGSKVRQ
jgi:hypothetical protein